MPVILDGAALASRRRTALAALSADVRRRRGSAPRLLIVAFADADGRVPHVDRKLRACEQSGVRAQPLFLPAHAETTAVLECMDDAVREYDPDGVFLQFPFPDAVDGDVVAAAIPVESDVDIMTPARIERYLSGVDDLPPVTVSAALLLLDEFEVSVEGRRGVVVADETPFSLMFSEAMRRRGAAMAPLLPPSAPHLHDELRRADLVVAAAARPKLVPASILARGCVAIDVGYFNRGGRGDIDTNGGVDHLHAIMPVPGGIGPMTVSALIERTARFVS